MTVESSLMRSTRCTTSSNRRRFFIGSPCVVEDTRRRVTKSTSLLCIKGRSSRREHDMSLQACLLEPAELRAFRLTCWDWSCCSLVLASACMQASCHPANTLMPGTGDLLGAALVSTDVSSLNPVQGKLDITAPCRSTSEGT
eukprot:365849-Chlamydomonas_euryale.AAC.9